MRTKPGTALSVYARHDVLVREFEERVRAKINSMALVPTHYRSMTDVILRRNNTWDDHIRTQQKDAELSRAKIGAVLARRDLALAFIEVAELPLDAQRASEERARRHDAVMLKIDYDREALETAIAELRHKRRLIEARTNHAIRQLGGAVDDADGFDPSVVAATSKRVRRFRERIAEERAIRAERDAEIAKVRRMGLSADEQDALIRAVEERADELLNEEGGA